MNFTITEVGKVSRNNFLIEETLYDVNYANFVERFVDADHEVSEMLREFVERFTALMSETDKISVSFFHKMFQLPIVIPFVRKADFTQELLEKYFFKVVQSYRYTIVSDLNSLTAKVQIVRIPTGSGRRKLEEWEKKPKKTYYVRKTDFVPKEKVDKPKTRVKNLKKKQVQYTPVANRVKPQEKFSFIQKRVNKMKSITKINRNDHLCALREILIGKAKCDIKNDLIKKSPTTMQMNKEMRIICKKLNLANKPMGIPEIIQIERYLKNYSINVIDGRKGKMSEDMFLYTGPFNKYFIYILYTESHFNHLGEMTTFLVTSYFCNYCKKGYKENEKHSCLATCISCKKQDCNAINDDIRCKKCNQKARNEQCLLYHTEYICSKKKKCDLCGQIYIGKQHVCIGEKYCVNCKVVVKEDHKCFQKRDKIINSKRKPFVFFDYECYQKNFKHVPNYIVAKKVCVSCLDNKSMQCNCENVEFKNNNDFCEWLFEQEEELVAICHNFKGYDSSFVMEWILENMTSLDKTPDVLMNGSKILSLKFRKIKIIDSLSFLPMPLDKFSKTFDIKELKKGFFPHNFNKEENQAYVGVWPTKDDFGIKFMTIEKKDEFEKWYDSNCNSTYDFQHELKMYCRSDVDLLMKGCLAFRNNIIELTTKHDDKDFENGIDPFCVSVTIASLCHYIFRNQMLKKDEIAILPQNGYYKNQNHSVKALQWIEYLASKKNVHIKHARNGGEQLIGGIPVDGFDEENNTVYQFHGCFLHACPVCFKPETFNKVKLKSMGAIYKEHFRKIEKLKSMEHNGKKIVLIEIWECSFDKMLKENEELKEFLKNFDIKMPLNVRDSFFGGRTEPIKLHHKCEGDEKINYFDITSLYPYVQSYRRYPIGHPEIILKDFKDINEYFGFVKLKILPPQNLYIPVLPMKSNGKLLFALCKTCADNKMGKCTHNDDERAIEGTYCTEEVKEAVRQGYKIEKIYEVWHWNESSEDLFKEYIATFLKGKQEASGFPDHVKNIEDELNYIEEYFKHEGIKLDREKIKYNAGLRAVLKILLNSFWGKYGQKENKFMFEIITKTSEWIQLITNEQYIVQRADYTNNKYLQVYYKNKSEINECETKTNNVALASFVTCYGRLKLLEALKKLGKRVIYCDTDSCLYTSRPGEYDLPLGDYLGEFTNEIDGKKGTCIKEAASIAPKSYVYITDNGFTHALVKGITFNHITKLEINFSVLKDMIFNDNNMKVQVEQLQFIRDKKDWSMRTEVGLKNIGFTFDKRIVLNNKFETIPFGYVE
jgi:hypothetical protein